MTTPNALAKELGVDPRKLRKFLRNQFPRLKSQKWTDWEINEGMEVLCRDHFS